MKRSKFGVEYRGMWFAKDQKTGYHLNSANRKRLHRYVWECERGQIPEGYDIHHKDENKENNRIENLEMLNRRDHCLLHCRTMSEEKRNRLRENMNKHARPTAIRWHKSESGRKWHQKQEKDFHSVFNVRVEGSCKVCGKRFSGTPRQMFCSNACKSRWRRMQCVDDIELTCCICGKKIKRNKYAIRKGQEDFACNGTCKAYLIGIKKREKMIMERGIESVKDQRGVAPEWVVDERVKHSDKI